ncbi:MFS transporter [Paenibacillus radicis (ex Xue et al. 2023)]|uniref:MFS transporter n=1 Tax=Paenibacillus radicis (ex Xue et al. 2023) TaxID=2972489 RepID=A0ABT1YHQ5_9BACL|nr:MFS transporter [Paenibacillus radicis (ex Xue et al. 2023)]MCR8632722.1 MFS transporter [Paenibacillus radicis (ex Xue et al. 2023)]
MGTTWFKEPRYAWIGLGSLWIIGFIGALTRFTMAYFQVQISEDLEISRGFISMAWSTNLLITAFCAPLGGWLVDRYGPKKVMLVSAILGTIGTGTVILGHHPIIFFIGYGVISGFVGIGTSTSYMLMFEWFQHHRAKATSLLASASSVGLAISTPIFVSSSWLTWKDAFLISFVLGIIVTLPTICFGIKGLGLKDNKADKVQENEIITVDDQEIPKATRPLFKGIAAPLPIFIVVACALFTCGFNMGTVEMNLVAIHQSVNVSPSMIALSMSVLGVMEITGSLIFGYFLDRVNKLVMMTILYGIRILGFAFLFIHVDWSPVLFAIAFGITYLSAIPGGLLIANEFSKGNGKQTGFLLLFHQGGGILGALIGGISFDYFNNYQVLIGVDVLICTLMTLGYFFLYTALKRSFRLHNVNASA